MVKLRGPLFSLSAHGWLGKGVYKRLGLVTEPYPIGLLPDHLQNHIYYSPKGWCYQRCRTWHGIQPRAIRPPISENKKTEAQLVCQNKFADAISTWQSMNNVTKSYYRGLKYPLKMSGYNRFIRMYMNEE